MIYFCIIWHEQRSSGLVLKTTDKAEFVTFLRSCKKDPTIISLRYLVNENGTFLSFARTRDGARGLQGLQPYKRPAVMQYLKYINFSKEVTE